MEAEDISDEAKDAQDANRLIPPFDSVTDDPAEIYRLHDVIPDPEWKSIPVGPLEIAASDGERTSLLPYRGSKWIRVNFHPKLPEDKKQKKRRLCVHVTLMSSAYLTGPRQTLYYISAMFAFRRFTERTLRFEKEQIQKAMDGVPSLIIDGLLSRFTEVSRGAAVYVNFLVTHFHLRRLDRRETMFLMFGQVSMHDHNANEAYELSLGALSTRRQFRNRLHHTGS